MFGIGTPVALSTTVMVKESSGHAALQLRRERARESRRASDHRP